MKRLADLVFVFTTLFLFAPSPALAYLDPASISMAAQVVTGAVASFFLFGRTYLAKVTNIFKRGSSAAARIPGDNPKG